MNDNHKTKEQLVQELEDLRRKIAELEITEIQRKRAEEALRESEEKYRSLALNEDPMYFVDRECRYRFMNKAHLLRLGLSLHKVIGRSYGEFHSEEDTKQFADRVEAVFATGNSFQTEHRSERDNRYFLRTFSPVKDLQRNITDVTVISKDITERKRAEEALQESEKNYRNLFENVNEAIFVAQEGKLVFLNPKTVIIIGYSAEELMSRPFIEFIHSDDRELVLDRHVRRMKGEELPQAYDFRVIQKDNNIRWVELKVVAIHWKGKPATLNLLYDITERKQTEKLLLASEARLKAQYQGSPIATFTWQKKGDNFELVDYNQAAKEATKGKVIKYLGKTATEMYRGRQEILQDIHRSFTDRRIIKKELQSQHFMVGRTMIATYAFVPPDLVMVHAEDISERKRIEEALRESEERYRTAIEQSNDGIALVKRDRHIFVNQKMVEIFGYDRPEEIIGQPVAMLVHPDDRERVRNLNRQRQKGESVPDKYEVKGQRKNGEPIYIEISATKTTYQKEAISLVYLRDITDRKRGEEALRTLSIKDDLTGLYNRRGFFALAEQGLKTAQRMGTEMLLIYGDLNNLKEINDTFGHKEGDQALVDISQILKETFRESDVLARIGGDEFVMLAMDTLETSAEKLINRFEQVLNGHHLQTKRPYKLSLSLGMACFDPKNPCSIEVLLAEADRLMYENKKKRVISSELLALCV